MKRLDQCHLHHAGAEGITANTSNTSFLYITNNHFHHFTEPNSTGEAMYLGANHGKHVMSYSVIANNHVHDCGGTQGDGIEIKQGSHHNWVYRNHIHDTNYPCIVAYGTAGEGINVIEQNTCYRSNDNVIQVQGEALVVNNLLMAAKGAGIASTDHQGQSRDLTLLHNTIISQTLGANLSSWNGRQKMVLANNLIYTDSGDAIRFPNGRAGVTIMGNVVVGRTPSGLEGVIRGKGLEDLANVTWDAEQHDARLHEDSELRQRGAIQFETEFDINGDVRPDPPPTSGAYK